MKARSLDGKTRFGISGADTTMWHTNTGDRTLEGAEARLFAETLWDFISELEVEGGDFDAGLRVFDCLTYGQKLSVLSIIANGLLKPDVPICKLTAAVESAIAAVFEYLKILVILEINAPAIPSSWRKMVLAARMESGAEDLPHEDCQDEEEWLFQVEELSCLILWDHDFEDENLYLDKPPEEAWVLKGFMDIDDNYFLDIPDDLKLKEIGTTLGELKALCQSVCERTDAT
jgi:hypothetical protein